MTGNRNLPRYNQMNINVATWARILKRSQPSDHHQSLTASSSSSLAGSTSSRPSSVSSSSTRPLPLNMMTSPASTSLPVTAATGNSPPALQPSLDTPTDHHHHGASNKQLETPGEKQPAGQGTHSAARPLSLSLSSPTSPQGVTTPSPVGMVTSPITPPVVQPGTMIPIQFPPSGKKPAPPPPPRTTSVISIGGGHLTPVQPPTVPAMMPRPFSSTPDSTVEEAKVRSGSIHSISRVYRLCPSSSSFYHLHFFTCHTWWFVCVRKKKERKTKRVRGMTSTLPFLWRLYSLGESCPSISVKFRHLIPHFFSFGDLR